MKKENNWQAILYMESPFLFFKSIDMNIEKINIGEKMSQFGDYFNPRIAGELNGQQVKLVKFKGGIIVKRKMNCFM